MLAIHVLMGLNARKPVFGGLISDFVIRFLESIIYKLATGEITIFELVSAAEMTGLSLAFFFLKTGFVAPEPILQCITISHVHISIKSGVKQK